MNTLEKVVTPNQAKDNSAEGVPVHGHGSEKETVKKWTEKKYKSRKLADALVEVAKDEEDAVWLKRYTWSQKCLGEFQTGNGKAFGWYCTKKWCPICLGVRKAKHINQYFPIIQNFEMPTFLTLTAKSHKQEELGMWVEFLIATLNRILNKYKQRHHRGKSEKFQGLICMECCFNPIELTYNPHFHIITANYTTARIIREEWLKAFENKKYVHPDAQYIDVVRDRHKNLIEVIKYGAKIVTDPEMKKGNKRTRLPYIYAAAIHEINKAFHKKHLIRKFGIDLPKIHKENQVQIIPDLQGWEYDIDINTYVNTETGQLLTKPYIPNMKLENIYEHNVDLKTK